MLQNEDLPQHEVWKSGLVEEDQFFGHIVHWSQCIRFIFLGLCKWQSVLLKSDI